jgi:hypothetical protein
LMESGGSGCQCHSRWLDRMNSMIGDPVLLGACDAVRLERHRVNVDMVRAVRFGGRYGCNAPVQLNSNVCY